MTNSRSAVRAARARLTVETLEDRAVPATFSFAGVTFEQDSTPDTRTSLAAGTYSGAIVTATPSSATGSVSGFPTSTSGFNNNLTLGTLINNTGTARALNLPAGNNGASARSGVELSWSGNRALQNQTGTDLVVYESGTVSGASAAPEALMIQVRDAITLNWSSWYYVSASSAAAYGGAGTEGAFAFVYDLSDMGIASNGYIDRVRVVNMTDEDRMTDSTGVGAVIPEDNGATSTNLPAPGTLATFTNFGSSTLDPDPLYVGAFNALTSPLVDVSVTKTDNATEVIAGQQVTYTIVVSNSGPNAASGVTFTDTLPTDLTGATWTSTAAGGATGNTAAGSGDISETLNLPVNATVTYTVTGTVAATAGGTLSNSATATAPSGTLDADTSNDTAVDTTTIIPLVDVSVTKTDGLTTANIGDTITYTIVVTNSGPSAANGVTFTDTMPVNLFPVTWTSTATGGATGNSATGNGNINETLNLPAGATVTYTVTGTAMFSGGLNNLASATVPATVSDSDLSNNDALDTTDVLLPTPPVLPQPPVIVPVPLYAVASGTNGHIKAYDSTGAEKLSFFAFQNYTGTVTVATGDLNGDGVYDIVVGAGSSTGGHVKAFDGSTGAEIASFFSFPGFVGGVSVAIGDINNDGDNDIIVGTATASSHVKAFDFGTTTELASFFAYAGFTGGISVASGDYNNDGTDDIVTGTATGSTHVKVFGAGQETQLLASFFAQTGDGGVNVGAGDLTGDGFAELLVGTNGSSSTAIVYTGGTGTDTELRRVQPFPGIRGVRVATGFVNNDTTLDLLTGSGPGGGRVRAFDGVTNADVADFVPFTGFTGGVFVG